MDKFQLHEFEIMVATDTLNAIRELHSSMGVSKLTAKIEKLKERCVDELLRLVGPTPSSVIIPDEQQPVTPTYSLAFGKQMEKGVVYEARNMVAFDLDSGHAGGIDRKAYVRRDHIAAVSGPDNAATVMICGGQIIYTAESQEAVLKKLGWWEAE